MYIFVFCQTTGFSVSLGLFLDTSEPRFSIFIPHCLLHRYYTRSKSLMTINTCSLFKDKKS